MNTIKILGIIVFVAVISFSFVTCDSGNNSTSDVVTLTISGMPEEYNNLWAYAETADDVFFAAEKAKWNTTNMDWSTSIITNCKISNGSVTLNVFSNDGSKLSGSMVFKVGIMKVKTWNDDSDFSAIFENYRDTGLTIIFNGAHGTGTW